MESYLQGLINAFGHRCEECSYYGDMRCTNPNWHGSKRSEIVHGDVHGTADGCVRPV